VQPSWVWCQTSLVEFWQHLVR